MDTWLYVTIHRHEPRGYGLWMFAADTERLSFVGRWGEVARRARRWARANHATRLVVLP